MSMLDSLRSALALVTAKLFPPEPVRTSPEPESPGEFAPPPDEFVNPEDLQPEVFAGDEEADEDSESSKAGQLQTEVDGLQDRFTNLSAEVESLRQQQDGAGEDAELLSDEQYLCKLQENIAGEATGSVKLAVYQNSAMSGWQIVEFGPAFTAYNCGKTDGVTGDVALLQFGDHAAPCFQVSHGKDVVDYAGVVVAEAATAGVATTPPRSDMIPGLKLRKNADPAPKAISALMFGSASSGLQFQIAAAANENAERAATAHAHPTIEVVPGGGGQVKIKAAPSPSDAFAHLAVDADGLRVPLDPAGGLENTGDGAEVKVGYNLYIDVGNFVNARCGWAVGDFKLRYSIGDIANSPPGFCWLECDGDAYDPGSYPELHDILPDHFLPDLRRRFLMGCHPSDGAFGLGANDGAAIGSRTPTTHGHALTLAIANHSLAHTHTPTVTGHTNNSADASASATDEATGTAMGPYKNFGDAGTMYGHYHGIPADAFQHHKHGWEQDSGSTDSQLGATSHDTAGSSVTDNTTWPPFYALGVYILAKKTA